MLSPIKFRSYGTALLAILPLLINEMIGSPKATPILLFPASVCVIYFVLKRLERTRFPLAKDANSGIKLMFLGLATLTFLPLMLSQNNPTGKIQAVLFISYVPLFYVLLLLLEKANRRGSVTVALGAVIFSAVNAIYHGLTGGDIDYLVFASILDTNTKEAIEFLSSAFSVRFALLMVASLVVILAFSRLARNILVGRRFFPAKVTHAVLLAIPLSGALHLSQSRYKMTEFYPVKEVYQLVRYFNEVHVIVKEYRNLEYEFKGDLSHDNGVTVILVLGESARMESLGIYGSEHDTTPHLDRFARQNPDNLLLFTDAAAAAS